MLCMLNFDRFLNTSIVYKPITQDLAVMPVNDQSSDSSSSNSCSELSDSDSDCITCTSDSVQQKPSIIRTSKRPQIEEVGEL